jgi:hypothetical protein
VKERVVYRSRFMVGEHIKRSGAHYHCDSSMSAVAETLIYNPPAPTVRIGYLPAASCTLPWLATRMVLQ